MSELLNKINDCHQKTIDAMRENNLGRQGEAYAGHWIFWLIFSFYMGVPAYEFDKAEQEMLKEEWKL